MTKRLRQFNLSDGTTRTVTWLPDDKRLRVGARVTLKDSDEPKRLWKVERRGAVVMEHSAIHRTWPVGGLLVMDRR